MALFLPSVQFCGRISIIIIIVLLIVLIIWRNCLQFDYYYFCCWLRYLMVNKDFRSIIIDNWSIFKRLAANCQLHADDSLLCTWNCECEYRELMIELIDGKQLELVENSQ